MEQHKNIDKIYDILFNKYDQNNVLTPYNFLIMKTVTSINRLLN